MLLSKHTYRSNVWFCVFAVMLSFALSITSLLNISLRTIPIALDAEAIAGNYVVEEESAPHLAKYVTLGSHNAHSSSARSRSASSLFFKKMNGGDVLSIQRSLENAHGFYDDHFAFIIRPAYYLFLFRYTLF